MSTSDFLNVTKFTQVIPDQKCNRKCVNTSLQHIFQSQTGLLTLCHHIWLKYCLPKNFTNLHERCLWCFWYLNVCSPSLYCVWGTSSTLCLQGRVRGSSKAALPSSLLPTAALPSSLIPTTALPSSLSTAAHVVYGNPGRVTQGNPPLLLPAAGHLVHCDPFPAYLWQDWDNVPSGQQTRLLPSILKYIRYYIGPNLIRPLPKLIQF